MLEDGIAALLGGSLNQSGAASCRAEASLLSDWLFALDLVVAGRLARDLATAFETIPDIHSAAGIAETVHRVRTVVGVAEREWADVEAGEKQVHFVSGANAQIDAVAWHLQQNGFGVSSSPTFFSAPDDADALIVMSPHPTDALQLLSTVGQRSPNVVRALVHKADTAMGELLRVAPSVELLLRYDAPPGELANQIMMSLRPPQRAWGQAVLYGANDLYPQLVSVGFQGLIAESTRSLIHAIATGSRIAVIGEEAEQRVELVRLIRSSPATRAAIIAVACDSDVEQEQCLRAGADLTVSATSAAPWAEQLRALATAQDQASGVIADETRPLPAGHRAWVLLERSINEVQRGRANASLATLYLPAGLDQAELLRAQHELSEEFRRDDTIAEIDERTVAVVLRGASMEKAVERIERAIKSLDLPFVPGTAGIAQFPDDGLGVKELVETAAAAAMRSRESTGPVVTRSDWFPGIEDRLDIFVVESEPTLARLLEQLLLREGYSTSIVGTGSAALSTLTGPKALAAPRLILLELDAMGADGMMILRSLARAGVLKQSKMIVTCSLVNDGQLREAFELGAVDMISKPFSSVVLRNRIEQALSE